MAVEIKSLPELRVAGLRHTGPYSKIAEAFARLGPIAATSGLFNDPAAQMLAVYHDDPTVTPESELRSDATIVVSAGRPIPSGLTEQIVQGGQYACAVHKGPYSKLPDLWNRLMSSDVPATGLQLARGPSLEVYLNNPMDTAEQDLLTEIRIPVTS